MEVGDIWIHGITNVDCIFLWGMKDSFFEKNKHIEIKYIFLSSL